MAGPATLGKHPIHPMLVALPIGLWIFSLVADLIYLCRGNPCGETVITISGWLGGEMVYVHGVAVELQPDLSADGRSKARVENSR